eukprot:4513242-Amphidinium_carterae.4
MGDRICCITNGIIRIRGGRESLRPRIDKGGSAARRGAQAHRAFLVRGTSAKERPGLGRAECLGAGAEWALGRN